MLAPDDLRDLLLRLCGVVDAVLRCLRSHGGPYNPDVHRVQCNVQEIRKLLMMTAAPAHIITRERVH